MLLPRMVRKLFILTLLLAAISVAPNSDAKSRSKPRRSDGTYSLNVAGFYTGTGKAQVTSGSVHLTLSLSPEAGGRSNSVDVTMALTANRFTGETTAFGKAIHLEGRLDVPDDDKERALRGVRLVCRLRIVTPENPTYNYASVIGFVPDVPRDAIDNGDDTNKGKGNGNGNGNG